MIFRHIASLIAISQKEPIISKSLHNCTGNKFSLRRITINHDNNNNNNQDNILYGRERFTIGPSARKFSMATDHFTVTYVTAPNEKEAHNLAKLLVETRLAACVSIIKTIESIYEWDGRINQENESMLIIKSHSSKTKDLTEFVEKNHTYECPEVVTIKVDSGSKGYLNWVQESISKKPLVTVTSEKK